MDWSYNCLVTLISWGYFTAGFVVLYLPRYLVASWPRGRRRQRFQRLTCHFYHQFFRLLRWLAPRIRWQIDARLSGAAGAVVVANHCSFLDPLLLISLWPRQRTVVKARYFRMPIFSWFITQMGYLPADGQGSLAGMLAEGVNRLPAYLQQGGMFFLFPEGTRSRTGALGSFSRAALKMVRYCRAPVWVVRIQGTDRLYPPDRFCLAAREEHTISLELVDVLSAATVCQQTLAEFENRIRQALAGIGRDRPHEKEVKQ